MKRVIKLSKQNSSWDITSIHYFTIRYYQVDEYGNFYRNGKICDVKPDAKGNKFFMLIDDESKKIRFKAHQIVLQTYIPDGLKSGLSVDHINKNRLDNRLSNLRFATRYEQYLNRDNLSGKTKKVLCINTGKVYESCKDAENDLGLTKNTVSRVARRNRKSIHGYKFKYL